jgi:hypothetical protein
MAIVNWVWERAACQAWVLHQALEAARGRACKGQVTFREQLFNGLLRCIDPGVACYRVGSVVRTPAPAAAGVAAAPDATMPNVAAAAAPMLLLPAARIRVQGTLPERRLDTSHDHRKERVDDDSARLVCKLCYFTARREHKSPWKCTACDVFLCSGTGSRQCFDTYHSPTAVIVPYVKPQ